MEALKAREASFDFETVFHLHYDRVARIIARVLGEPARAEELAVEVFWKLWRTPRALGENVGGWLYRTSVRTGLYELRRRRRRGRIVDAGLGRLRSAPGKLSAAPLAEVAAAGSGSSTHACDGRTSG